MAVFARFDICGSEVTKWYTVTPHPSASSQYSNLSDMLAYSKTYEVCKECLENLFAQK